MQFAFWRSSSYDSSNSFAYRHVGISACEVASKLPAATAPEEANGHLPPTRTSPHVHQPGRPARIDTALEPQSVLFQRSNPADHRQFFVPVTPRSTNMGSQPNGTNGRNLRTPYMPSSIPSSSKLTLDQRISDPVVDLTPVLSDMSYTNADPTFGYHRQIPFERRPGQPIAPTPYSRKRPLSAVNGNGNGMSDHVVTAPVNKRWRPIASDSSMYPVKQEPISPVLSPRWAPLPRDISRLQDENGGMAVLQESPRESIHSASSFKERANRRASYYRIAFAVSLICS